MRPALQKLLTRPSSLELLRHLVGPSTTSSCAKDILGPRSRERRKRYFSTAPDIQELDSSKPLSHEYEDREEGTAPYTVPRIETQTLVEKAHFNAQDQPKIFQLNYGPWEELISTGQIEFESDLNGPGRKLVDNSLHKTDLRLWAHLLDYRTRIYGLEGVRMYWDAVLKGRLLLPVSGQFATKFWFAFLTLGFQDEKILNEICLYADHCLESTGTRWSGLYSTIIQQMIRSGKWREVVRWHNTLHEKHPPTEVSLLNLYRWTIHIGGDMEALRYIYGHNSCRSAYSKIVPNLCRRGEFFQASKWHFYLLRYGDLPRGSKTVEPLIHFMAIYFPQTAEQITQSLIEADVASSPALVVEEKTSKISREMMNLVHGSVLKIPEKEYNDNLGARWFATRWVSLDLAISATHALGIQQIGPLSLQAIALRDTTAENVKRRLDQLQELGISIGNSKFSKSVDKFARSGKQEFLDGLLNSDQHPDELEDNALQEDLLVSYARSKDWSQYRRTLAIRVIGSKSPQVESENIILRSHLHIGDTSSVLASLRKMQISGIPIMPHTIARILSTTLRRRRRGHRPAFQSAKGHKGDDLSLAITILRGILEAGSFVPANFWREIIKRLGMLGRFEELSHLSTFLASWYGPVQGPAIIKPERMSRPYRYETAKDVPTSHHLHPLRILFPDVFQRAVVEWGVIQGLRAQSVKCRPGRLQVPMNQEITRGIKLLKKLHQYGVYIDSVAMRRAILNRLIIYYGPGKSCRLYNRADRARNTLTLPQMAHQIDEALERQEFFKPGLRDFVEYIGMKRLRRRTKEFTRRGTTFDSTLLRLPSLPDHSSTDKYSIA